jgi:hypothetical protein
MEHYRPYSMVNVPSQGMYYPDKKDFFYIRYLSYEEEYILTDQTIMDNGDGIRKVLEAVIVDDFDIEKLVPGDVQAISMFLRSTAFGDKLELSLKCPKCNRKQDSSILISQFQMKEVEQLPDEGQMFNIELPVSKKKVKLRVPTYLEEVEAAHQGKMGFANKLERIIVKIGDLTDKRQISGVVPNMPIKDSRFLKDFLEKNTPGVKTEVTHECESCHHEFIQKFSTDHNFLRLPSDYRQGMMEQIFNISYHSQGGISWSEAIKMPTVERMWLMNRLKKAVDDRNAQERKSMSKGR